MLTGYKPSTVPGTGDMWRSCRTCDMCLQELTPPVDKTTHKNTTKLCVLSKSSLLPTVATFTEDLPCARHWIHTGERKRQDFGPDGAYNLVEETGMDK